MTSGVRDLSATFGAKAVCLLLTIGTQSCLAWSLGTVGRGSYAVCLVFATLLSVIFVVGCDAASIYFVSSGRFTLSEGIVYTIIYGGIGSGLAIAVGLIVMQFDFSFFDKASSVSFYLSLALIPTLLFSTILISLFTSIHHFILFAVMSIVNAFLILAFTAVFVWVFQWGVNGALLGNFTGSALAALGALFLFWWKCDARWVRPSAKSLLDMFHYGVRYHIGKISNLMNFQIGTIILALFATKADVGLFAVASQVTFRAMMIPDALTTVLIPRLAQDKTGKRNLVAQCSRLTALFCGLLLMLVAVFARPIVTVIFSPAFLPSVPLIRILALGVFVRSVCKVFVPYLLGTNHPGIASLSVAVGMLLNLIVLWLLLPMVGLLGAALAVTVSYFASSAILVVSFSRLSQLKIREIWGFRRLDWALLSGGIKYAYLSLTAGRAG